ncbi:MAG: hypothetical protein HY812_09560 [Planctomycetes bacterium]|nr:hypothetical protein [Planctomycetota bacterium]
MGGRSLLAGFLAGAAVAAAAILLAGSDGLADHVEPVRADAAEASPAESASGALRPLVADPHDPPTVARPEAEPREAVETRAPAGAPPGIPWAWIRGRAVDGRGRGLDGAWVTAKRRRAEGAGDAARTRSGSGGRFVVYGLEEGESYDLYIDAHPASLPALSAIRAEEVPAAFEVLPMKLLPCRTYSLGTLLPAGRYELGIGSGGRAERRSIVIKAAATTDLDLQRA